MKLSLDITKENGEIKHLNFNTTSEKKCLSNLMFINDIPKLECKYNYKTPTKPGWQQGNNNKLRPNSKSKP